MKMNAHSLKNTFYHFNIRPFTRLTVPNPEDGDGPVFQDRYLMLMIRPAQYSLCLNYTPAKAGKFPPLKVVVNGWLKYKIPTEAFPHFAVDGESCHLTKVALTLPAMPFVRSLKP